MKTAPKFEVPSSSQTHSMLSDLAEKMHEASFKTGTPSEPIDRFLEEILEAEKC